jgi:hypothetical protein
MLDAPVIVFEKIGQQFDDLSLDVRHVHSMYVKDIAGLCRHVNAAPRDLQPLYPGAWPGITER